MKLGNLKSFNSIFTTFFIVLILPVAIAAQLDYYLTSWHVFAKTYIWPLQLKELVAISAFYLVIKSKDAFAIQVEHLIRNLFLKWLILFLVIQCLIFLVIDFPVVAEWLARIVLILLIPTLFKGFLIGGIFQVKNIIDFNFYDYIREFYQIRKELLASIVITFCMGLMYVLYYKTEWTKLNKAIPYHAEIKEVYFPEQNTITPYNPSLNLTLEIKHLGGQPIVWDNSGEKQVFLGIHWFKKDSQTSDKEFIPMRAFYSSRHPLHQKVFPFETVLESITLNAEGVPNGDYIVAISLQQGTKHHMVWFPNFSSNLIKVPVSVNIPNRLKSQTIGMSRTLEMRVLNNQDVTIALPNLVKSELSYTNLGNKFAIQIKNVGETPWDVTGYLNMGIGYRCISDKIEGDIIVNAGIVRTRQTMYQSESDTIFLLKNPDWINLCSYLKVGLVAGETWMEGFGDPVLTIPNKELKYERGLSKENFQVEDNIHFNVIQVQKELVQSFIREATNSKIPVSLQIFNHGEIIQDKLNRWANIQVLELKIHNMSTLTLPTQLVSVPDLGGALVTIKIKSLYGIEMEKMEFMLPFNLPPSAWIIQPFRLSKPLSQGEYKLILSLDFTYPPRNKIPLLEKKYAYFIH